MIRRNFLVALPGLAFLFKSKSIDINNLTWPPASGKNITEAQICAMELDMAQSRIPSIFEREDAFFAMSRELGISKPLTHDLNDDTIKIALFNSDEDLDYFDDWS